MSRDSFINRDSKRGTPSHRRAPKQERELASRFKGKTTIASGALSEKGDVRVRRLIRIEAKTTKNKSFSITQEMLDKIETAALAADEIPVMVIEFNDGCGRKMREVAVLPTYALDAIGGKEW